MEDDSMKQNSFSLSMNEAVQLLCITSHSYVWTHTYYVQNISNGPFF